MINSSLSRGPTLSWRNGDAQCCQLSNIADPFSAQTSFWESLVLPRERKVFLSQRAHTPLSLSLSASAPFSARTSLSFSLSLRLLSARQREEQRFNSVKHRYYVASLLLHASIAEITAQLLSLSYVCLISSDDGAIIMIFLCRLTSWKGAGYVVLMGRVSVTISYSSRCLTTETVKYTSFIENLASSKYSMWAKIGKQM